MRFAEERLKINGAVATWCMRNAARCRRRGRIEDALQWYQLSARVMACECVPLVSPELEKQLVEIGAELETPERVFKAGLPRRWLHVLTEVREDGGHSAMLKRWIQHDPQQNAHSIALLSQTVPVPSLLSELTRSRNGEIHEIDGNQTITAKTGMLRDLVMNNADVVVLHTHPWDITPTVALAQAGGPPVLLVNHAAHIFWVGVSVADVVLDCRVSQKEDEWTVRHRSVSKIMHLPLPLSEPYVSLAQKAEEARKFRDSHNIPLDAPVMLSVGIGNKYTPLEGANFIQLMRSVLEADQHAFLVVVGPQDNAHWEELRKHSGGRFILVEKQRDIAMPVFFQAADLYLEGFPFGSTTACLEAALAGLPCILPPAACPPPFTTDGIAMDLFERAADISTYLERIHLLLNNREERLKCGERFSRSVRSHHCGTGWARYLADIQKKLPDVHRVRSLHEQEHVDPVYSGYWTAFSALINEDPLVSTFRLARSLGLSPKIDCKFFLCLLRHGSRGRKRGELPTWKLVSDTCVSYLIGMAKLVRRSWTTVRHGAATFCNGVSTKCPMEK